MANEHPRIGAAVVGYGYWGPNIVRNLSESADFHLVGVCEPDELRLSDFVERHPGARVEKEFQAVLDNPEVEAVAIATPPHTHCPLVRQALDAGKHVLVEKPLATEVCDAIELIEVARRQGAVLMPGHTFVYSPAVQKVQELIRDDVLGDVYFVTSSRMNLGKYQKSGVICDLAPHDLSILMHWLGEPLVEVTATGRSVFFDGIPETAFLNLTFAGGAQANVQLSWLAPRKVRQMVVVGSKRMVHYEDTAADESVRIYDRGMDFQDPPSNFGEYRLTYRTGDMVAPRIEAAEPLGLELQDFAKAIREGTKPRSSDVLGLQIVVALEALGESLRNGGKPVSVPATPIVPDALPVAAGGRFARASNGNGSGNGHGVDAPNRVDDVSSPWAR